MTLRDNNCPAQPSVQSVARAAAKKGSPAPDAAPSLLPTLITPVTAGRGGAAGLDPIDAMDGSAGDASDVSEDLPKTKDFHRARDDCDGSGSCNEVSVRSAGRNTSSLSFEAPTKHPDSSCFGLVCSGSSKSPVSRSSLITLLAKFRPTHAARAADRTDGCTGQLSSCNVKSVSSPKTSLFLMRLRDCPLGCKSHHLCWAVSIRTSDGTRVTLEGALSVVWQTAIK